MELASPLSLSVALPSGGSHDQPYEIRESPPPPSATPPVPLLPVNPEVPSAPAFDRSHLASPANVRQWKQVVASSKHPRNNFDGTGFRSMNMVFESAMQGSQVVLDILAHFASNPHEDRQNTAFPPTFPLPGRLQQVSGSRSFFGDQLNLWVAGSPGQGPKRDILTGALRLIFTHTALWQEAPNESPFVVPCMFYGISAMSSDPKSYGAREGAPQIHSRASIFRAHGMMIAIYIYQLNLVPLPVSPWLLLYCILGDRITDPSCVPHGLLAKLDPKGWELYRRVLCLTPGNRRPMDIGRVANQLLLEYLDIDLLDVYPADMELTQEGCNELYELAMFVLIFGGNPKSHLKLGHPDLRAVKEGFDIALGQAASDSRPSFAMTFHLVSGALPWQLIGYLYHRFPENVERVLGNIEAYPPTPCSTRQAHVTELIQIRIRNWLKGCGYPWEMLTLGLVSDEEFKQFFRLRELLLAMTGTPQIPAMDPWRIKVRVTFESNRNPPGRVSYMLYFRGHSSDTQAPKDDSGY
ncbi:hypothetical protein V5O48_016197 [Marasmius crinis-equi]|uniref:Uncharacterized protein n=1 Tax=Marasmius crinis-equi TaxID=585013 RepID=A0ABR3ESE9_9AGAR